MKLPTPSHGPQLFLKKKTHPVCDAKKCKCAVAPFFFFFRKSVFHGHHTAKEHNLSETRVVRSL